jgi:hypothetical protein
MRPGDTVLFKCSSRDNPTTTMSSTLSKTRSMKDGSIEPEFTYRHVLVVADARETVEAILLHRIK